MGNIERQVDEVEGRAHMHVSACVFVCVRACVRACVGLLVRACGY